jgi:hypothetical protein
MTGDEIVATDFPLRAGGYDCSAVQQHLAFIADLHDRGFAPRSFTFTPPREVPRSSRRRECDPDAVDQFLDALASQAAASDLRVLPEVGLGTQSPFWTKYARDCRAQWRGVSDLPGARLRRAGRKIIGSHGEVLLTSGGRELTLANGQVFSAGPRNRIEAPVVSGTGDPILWIRGRHRDLHADGIVLLPGQRCLVFPVKGTGRRNGVMTAVNESGATVLWFRKMGLRVYEVVVSPECDITAEVLCVIELVAGWLSRYFPPMVEPGGG